MKEFQWNNEDNAEFYEKIPIKIFQHYAYMAGLDDYSDLVLIKEYIQKANSILEVGAGYGRVLEYLINIGFKGDITAIERSKKFYGELKYRFKKNKINLIHADIKHFQPKKKFDLILWLWSGICDFNKHEQISLIQHLSTLMNKLGTLIIDSFPPGILLLNGVSNNNQESIITLDGYQVFNYFPSTEEMNQYGQVLKFNTVKCILFKTSKERNRYFWIFKNTRPIGA